MTAARFSAGLLLVAALASGSLARADEHAAPPADSSAALTLCVESHERAGMLRLEERWSEAREAMQACSQESCPLTLRTDCARWLEELRDMLPTLLVVVERDDDGRAPLRVSLDGRELALSEPLRPIEVLPGTHRLDFELPSYAPLKHEVNVRIGEKNKVVRVRFAREAPPSPPAERAPSPAPVTRITHRPVPTSTYVFAGAGLLAFGGSGVMFAAALTRRDEARKRCAPGCYDGEREEVDRLLLGADIAAAGGLMLGGLAIYTFVARPTLVLPMRGNVEVLVGPTPAVTYKGRF